MNIIEKKDYINMNIKLSIYKYNILRRAIISKYI